MRIADVFAHNVESDATVIAVARASDGSVIVRVRRFTTMSSSYPLDVTLLRAPGSAWSHSGPAGAFLTRLYAAAEGEEFIYRRATYTRISVREADLPSVLRVPLPPGHSPWDERKLSESEAARVLRNYGLAPNAPLPTGREATTNGATT